MADENIAPPAPQPAEEALSPTPRDAYPRMIVVCMIITAVLLVVVVGVLVADFVTRARGNLQNAPQPFNMPLDFPPGSTPPEPPASDASNAHGGTPLP